MKKIVILTFLIFISCSQNSTQTEMSIDKVADKSTTTTSGQATSTSVPQTTTTTLPSEALDYLESLSDIRKSLVVLETKVTKNNEDWINLKLTYQEAKEVFLENINIALNIYDEIENLEAPEYKDLKTVHIKLKTLVLTIASNTEYIYEGLITEDTGQAREYSYKIFSTNFDRFEDGVIKLISSMTYNGNTTLPQSPLLTTTTSTTTTSTTTTSVPPNNSKYSKNGLEAFKDSFGDYEYHIRWKKDKVKIGIAGTPSQTQIETFNYVVGDLNRLIKDVVFEYEETSNFDNSDIKIYFGNYNTWNSINTDCNPVDDRRFVSGWEYLSGSGNAFDYGFACFITEEEYSNYLDSTNPNILSECAIYDIRAILSYLVTSSRRDANYELYGESIFAPRYCNNGTSYSSIDEEIIKIHYDSRVKNLDKIEDVVKLLDNFTFTTPTTVIQTDSEAPVWSSDPISFSKVNPTYLDILWGQATDNVQVKEYKIFMNGNLVKTIPEGSTKRTTILGLNPDTLYNFEIFACDNSGNCSTENPTASKRTPESSSSGSSSSGSSSSGSSSEGNTTTTTLACLDDDEPPVLVSYSYSPDSVDVSNSPGQVEVLLTVTDNCSGVGTGFYGIDVTTTPSTGFSTASLISGTNTNGVWKAVINIPQNHFQSTFSITLYPLGDNRQNTGGFTQLGTFEVINNP